MFLPIAATMIPGVILAAGGSTRMGRPKALLPIGPAGETFLSRIARTLRAAGLDDVVVVAGPDAAPIGALLDRDLPDVRLLVNARPDAGQLSSLHVALAALGRPGVRALLVTLVDHPLVLTPTVAALLAAYGRTGAGIVRPARAGRHGHPVIFDRRMFDALRRADPAAGARTVVHGHRQWVLDVEVDEDGPFLDIDTPEDYERIFGCPLPGS